MEKRKPISDMQFKRYLGKIVEITVADHVFGGTDRTLLDAKVWGLLHSFDDVKVIIQMWQIPGEGDLGAEFAALLRPAVTSIRELK